MVLPKWVHEWLYSSAICLVIPAQKKASGVYYIYISTTAEGFPFTVETSWLHLYFIRRQRLMAPVNFFYLLFWIIRPQPAWPNQKTGTFWLCHQHCFCRKYSHLGQGDAP